MWTWLLQIEPMQMWQKRPSLNVANDRKSHLLKKDNFDNLNR